MKKQLESYVKMLSGNIIDTYSDNKNNQMITWIVNNGRSERIADKYNPSFFVHSDKESLYTLASNLREHPFVKNQNFTKQKIILGKHKKSFVLEIFPKKINDLRPLAELVDSWGGYHKYNLYNVDNRLSSRYLQDKGVFSNASVKWDGKNFILEDCQWDVDFKPPLYKKSFFDIKRKKNTKVFSYENPIKSILIDDIVISERNEADTILLSLKQIDKIDPDILFAKKGDSVLFPYLYHRAEVNGIQNKLCLGRDKDQILRPIKKSKSYFTYGQIVYRPGFYTLKGRAHIDTHNSFMYGESGIPGLIDMSRCSNIPLQILSRVGPGTAISQMQVNKASEKGYLIPYKKNLPEGWKTAMNLLVSDRGGLILDPAVGLHEDVVEFDFASLYPNVMLRFNISPETMLCDCCKNSSSIVVPQLYYHICDRKIGLLPEVLKPVLFRRFCYKARSKNKNYDPELYKELQQAWKWVLLVCFGYTGYRNARYGRIECYESITAFSRDILLSAVEIVEDSGYSVLHGIIDSLWVKRIKKDVSPNKLSRLISNKTGVRMDVEGHYKWIVFLPSKNTGVGALTRYYGVFENGEIKVRGVEMRQRNSPAFLKKMQEEMINHFSKANKKSEFLKLIPSAFEIVERYAKKIINNNVKFKDLIISSSVSRGISEYKVNNHVKAALLNLRKEGVEPEPGQTIRYVVCDEKHKIHMKRVCIAENLDNCEKIDVDFYLRLIAQYTESLLIPFGYTREKIYEKLLKIKIRERYNVSVLPGIRTSQTSL